MSNRRYSSTAHIAPYWNLIPKMSPVKAEAKLLLTALFIVCLVATVVFAITENTLPAMWFGLASFAIPVAYLVYNELRSNRDS